MDWKSIWKNKGKTSSEELSLERLIAIDGFNIGAGAFPIESWITYVEAIRSKLALQKGNTILEVGCGSGAFLFPLYEAGIKVYGIDYAPALVEIASEMMPSGIFNTSEAAQIPFEDEAFDGVVSNSVFQYFESLAYAESVMAEIFRVLKPGGRMALLDVNDASKKEASEAIRRKKLGEAEFNRMYGNLTHLFFPKAWFEKIAQQQHFTCRIEDQHISGYGNSAFRYNVFLEK